jgi:hypothetical protein
MDAVEADLLSAQKKENASAVEKLNAVISIIIDRLEANRKLLSVILDYLLYISTRGIDPDGRVRRRTIRLRHILAQMVIEGRRSGELAPINVRVVDDLFYGLIESAIFRMAVLGRPSAAEVKKSAALALERLKANP